MIWLFLLTFNKKNINLRSYIFLESNKRFIFIDFNTENNDIKLKLDIEITTFLKLIFLRLLLAFPSNNEVFDPVALISEK